MKNKVKVMIGTIFILLVAVVILLGGIYQNTKPKEEYEVIVATTTVNVTALEKAGYFTIEKEGYILTETEDWINRWPRRPCPVCEAIQRGEITPTSWLEESDNFTVIMEEGAYDLSEPTFKFYPNNTHNIKIEEITSE